MRLRIATWNINSVRLRIGLVERLVREFDPDILCLQETKASNGEFPLAKLKALGFRHCEYDGMRGYNGVAICARRPLAQPRVLSWCGKSDSRHISARDQATGLEVHCVYVPAGGDVPDPATNPKFAHKLQFLRDLAAWLPTAATPEQPLVLLGDLNVAPLETDVWSHRQMIDVVSHTPVEIEHLGRLQASLSFVDTHRVFVPPDQKLYTWWSYRARDWQLSDRGRRLDHIWSTPVLKPRLRACFVHPAARGWPPKPSDHAPVFLDLEV